MPLIVPWTYAAPARTAATALAVATPKSLWPWKWTGTSGPTSSTVEPTRSATASGEAMPSVSTTTTSFAPGLDRARVDAAVEVGSARVESTPKNAAWMPLLGGEAHRARDPLEHLLARDADRVELQVGDRRLDHREAHAELDERLEVGRHRAREAPDLGVAGPAAEISSTARAVVVGDAREAGLDAVDAELVEQPRDLELLLGVEHDADGLLAVAQRRVVEADVPAEAVRVVQRAGPDQVVAHACSTTPSGNDESFSAPSAVIRKLSSTRRPPPPSQ